MPKASAQTRDRLLSATRSVIASDGWGAVTTRKVAAHAGLQAGLVHYHFDGIDDLRRQAVGQLLTAMADLPTDPESSMADLLAAGSDHESGVVLLEASLACLRDTQLRDAIGQTLAQARQRLAERTGDPAVAATVVAAIDGILLHRLIDPELDLSETAAVLTRLMEAKP